MGLLTGFSIISGVEILYFAFKIALDFYSKFRETSVAARHLRVKHVSLKLSSVPHTVQCGYKWSVKPGMIKESERVLSKSSCIVFDEDGIFFQETTQS